MKRFNTWIFAVFTALLMTGTASAQDWWSSTNNQVTETQSAHGGGFGVNVSMGGNAWASGGQTVAGTFGSFNYEAAPVSVEGEEVIPIRLSAGFSGLSEGADYSEAAGALDAYARTEMSAWDWSRVDSGANTEEYGAGGNLSAGVGANGFVNANEASIGAVGQYNYAVPLSDSTNITLGGAFGFNQDGSGLLEGAGEANSWLDFSIYSFEWADNP